MTFLTKPYSWGYAWKTTSFQGSLLLVRESPTNEFAWEKLACSRRSDSRAREKIKIHEGKKKNEGRLEGERARMPVNIPLQNSFRP